MQRRRLRRRRRAVWQDRLPPSKLDKGSICVWGEEGGGGERGRKERGGVRSALYPLLPPPTHTHPHHCPPAWQQRQSPPEALVRLPPTPHTHTSTPHQHTLNPHPPPTCVHCWQKRQSPPEALATLAALAWKEQILWRE